MIGLRYFDPRTPCGVRQVLEYTLKQADSFKFTHSVRSAISRPSISTVSSAILIHTLHGECDARARAEGYSISILIHALRMECDVFPVGLICIVRILIHALRMECDMRFLVMGKGYEYFNPRTPHGVRLGGANIRLRVDTF